MKEDLKLKIREILSDKKKVFSLVILLLGMVATVYLVGHQQLFRGRASAGIDFNKVFEIKDKKDNTLICIPTTAGANCPTQANEVIIYLKDIEPLLDN